MTSLTPNQRGIIALVSTMACFIVSDAILKIATATHPPSQLMAIRGVFATALALALVIAMGAAGHLRELLRPLVLTRGLLDGLVAYLYITALEYLPLAIITSILQASPIILTLMLVALGFERVGWRRWVAIIVGFFGVVLVAQPRVTGVDPAMLIALAAAVFAASRELLTSRLRSDIPSIVVTLSASASVGLLGGLVALAPNAAPWQPMPPGLIAWLALSAVIVTAGNFGLIYAYRDTDVSVVSLFRYSIILWAILAGYIVFGEVPNLLAVVGIGLIVGAGVYSTWREQVRKREALRVEALRRDSSA
jgi:drug/metabolite transporter (DMT)-like permease